MKALDGLIQDVQANPKARKAAVELLIHYGEPASHFAALLASYDGRSPDELEAARPALELLRSAADSKARPLGKRALNVVPPGVPIPIMPKLPAPATP